MFASRYERFSSRPDLSRAERLGAALRRLQAKYAKEIDRLERRDEHAEASFGDEGYEAVELEDESCLERSASLAWRFETVGAWIEHFQRFNEHDSAQAFPEYREALDWCLETLSGGAQEFADQEEGESLVPIRERGPSELKAFRRLLVLYDALDADDEFVFELGLRGDGMEWFPGAAAVGAWTRRQLGELIYGVADAAPNPARLLAGLEGREREALVEVFRGNAYKDTQSLGPSLPV